MAPMPNAVRAGIAIHPPGALAEQRHRELERC
jgi:hypothetical protein